ncbi:MAG TPA: class I SAM-dependent methyltransferase [Ramlibacter sp.]|nr:class I SAM-dependent methyltransferase [Ramlibacter sp.]
MRAPYPASKPPDRWERGSPYEQYMGHWSRQLATGFLQWLDLPAGLRWLDVGCGTGALTEAILAHAAPGRVAGIEPAQGFIDQARERLGARAQLQRGTAEALPLESACSDATVAGLMLNFVPDVAAGLREMVRVTADGGTVAAYVWDYAGRMELIKYFWEAAAELDPAAAALDEGQRFPLCRPDRLEAAFRGARLQDVTVTGIEIPTVFTDFSAYWSPFLGGQGPAPAYAMSLPPERREALRRALQERLPAQPDGAIALVARAWAVRGRVVR